MKFKFTVSPNYNAKSSTQTIMYDVMFALAFVSVCAIVLQYSLYGMAGAIRAIVILAICVLTCHLVDVIWLKLNKITGKDFFATIKTNVPTITGIILALTLPLGSLDSMAIYYVAFIGSIAAELFGKLIFGGFGYNIFNPAGVGRAFVLIAFGKYLVIPAIDGLAKASPLTTLQGENGLSAVSQTFDNYTSLLFGVHQGALGETVVIALIIAAIYLIARNAIDWVIPVTTMITVGLCAMVYSMVSTGFDLNFIIIHLLSGGLIFGAVFMLTDPVTNPLNRQGKIIYAIIFALLTFLIRAKASLPEGVVFSILICNMLVPMIDRFTANVTDKDVNKKVISILVTLVIALATTMLFSFVA
ncbi:MAG: RnfABCDGE type electron transport complex subunit D [Bacilli bacterium]|jgi:electron transport complex protein RnfD|nr:RnfABCDGE type electron transport complex subunit D [Bacilli bacterium]